MSNISVKLSIENDRYKVLGSGRYGTVFEGDWNGIKVAIKRIEKINAELSNEREVNALKICNHENVVKLFHTEEDRDFRYFALELCDASLDKLFIKEDDKKYRGPMLPNYQVLLQLAKGLEHIHKMELVHRDIKPYNVLIWVNGEKDKVLMKWADFGLSKRVNERGSHSISGSNRGTNDWFAPEILKIQIEEENEEDKTQRQRGTVKSDVFSEGLLFGYFLMNGNHLFGMRHEIAKNILENNPVRLPDTTEYRILIQKMLEEEPEKRISSSDVVNQLLLIKQSKNSQIFALFKRKNYPKVEEIEKLIQEGADINEKDENGLTPLLHLAKIEKENGDALGFVSLLIKNGANVNSIDNSKRNALHYLCLHYKSVNLIDIIRLLIEKEIDVNCKQNIGNNNALHYLCRFYQKGNLIEIIRLLIENSIDVNCKNIHGDNVLHILCQHYQNENLYEIIQLLIENSFNITSESLVYFKNNYKKGNREEVLQLLESNYLATLLKQAK